MPYGKIERDGTVTITFNPFNGDKLIVASGLQALPCESCGRVEIIATNIVSITCQECAQRIEAGEDLDDCTLLMERAFDLVKPRPDWKAAIDAYVRESDLARANVTIDNVRDAIVYYTATDATVQQAGGGYRVWAIGYRMGPAGP
jgi:hypothetical protein